MTAKALNGAKFGPALGVSTADFNGDGWIDIFVANDGEDDLLFINQKNGTFKETALAAGVAVTSEGKAEASMGVDAGDFDNDGDEDLIMTELTSQGFNLYLNDGHATFRDVSAASGLGAFSLPYTGWGTSWFDFDNDGWLDTMAVNGTIIAQEGHRDQDVSRTIRRNCCCRNLGNGRFEQVTSKAGRAFELSESGRGAAFGDIDNDGDIDVLIGNDAGPGASADQQHRQPSNHWLRPAPASAGEAGRARRARRGHAIERSDALAPCPLRRQLRIRERSARARRARRLDRNAARADSVA